MLRLCRLPVFTGSFFRICNSYHSGIDGIVFLRIDHDTSCRETVGLQNLKIYSNRSTRRNLRTILPCQNHRPFASGQVFEGTFYVRPFARLLTNRRCGHMLLYQRQRLILFISLGKIIQIRKVKFTVSVEICPFIFLCNLCFPVDQVNKPGLVFRRNGSVAVHISDQNRPRMLPARTVIVSSEEPGCKAYFIGPASDLDLLSVICKSGRRYLQFIDAFCQIIKGHAVLDFPYSFRGQCNLLILRIISLSAKCKIECHRLIPLQRLSDIHVYLPFIHVCFF